MKPPADRKLYLGPKLRVLRRELGLNQSQMADELGVSPSYLNHLERNQRPLSAQMLLRLADTYDIDVRDFVTGASAEAASGLREIFADPVLRDIGAPRDEIVELAENYPTMVEAITRLYRAIGDLRRMPQAIDRINGAATTSSALDWLRDHVHDNRNHFAELDSAAEALAGKLPDDPADLYLALRQRLEERRITAQIMPDATLGGALRFYDFHRKRLMLSERLPASGRLFALAFQLASIELAGAITAAIERARPDEEALPLMRVMLTNYAAAAIVMPYARFHTAAEEARYDLTRLEAKFGVSYEQVAHRLTTLARSGERGVPFFMLKVDHAGTISKRFAGEGLPLARFGGACPRWSLYRAFRSPGQTIAEAVEMPDGERYLTLSRTLADPARDRDALSVQAIALGCDIRHAERIAAADGLALDRPNPIGPACHVCERPACSDRALPPITRSLELSPHRRGAAPYPFRTV